MARRHSEGLDCDRSSLATNDHEPPAKRQKTQACLRCRKRKQKCDNCRPCANCTRSNQQCVEVPSTVYVQSPFSIPLPQYMTQDPLARLADIASLEERISRLEERGVLDPSGFDQNQDPTHQGSQGYHRVSAMTPAMPEEGVLMRSSPATGLLSTFARPLDDTSPTLTLQENEPMNHFSLQSDPEQSLSIPTKDGLLSIYNEKVQCRYPFLRLEHLRDRDGRPKDAVSAFFVNLIYSVGLLLDKSNQSITLQHRHKDHYRAAVTRYLSHVFAQPDRLLHIQAYLLLAMHAMYSPSTERIISIASATMRYCVMAQLYSAAAEPQASDAAGKVEIQMRRRVFWSAYALDRTVGAMFDLPFSIPDAQITVKMYANVDENQLEARCAEAYPDDPPSIPGLTNVSAALHVVYCRQIQSEILNTTLHRDFSKYLDKHRHWRLKIIEKLDRWRSLCHRYSDAHSKNFTNSEWLHMIYNYSLAMLYQPTQATVTESAGDWTVKACVQACLIFRKFQREKPVTELWLGMVAQFKCGVALLYCFFATPPGLRSPTYEIPEVAEAVRACSITLSLLAERWPQTKCVRDSFDILAREIPLYEPTSASTAVVPAAKRMRRESADTLLSLLPQVEMIIVNRNTLRMIREMVTEDFPRRTHCGQSMAEEAAAAELAVAPAGDSPSERTGITEDFFQPFTPHYIQLEMAGADEFENTAIGFPGEFDLGATF